ncbi:MAG: TldD/PmbA family protein [Candidatus Latescibacteria bacterium]|nr:TldD/PmbA family protein [Candidatus Latescibacterota bacterium]
MEKLLEMAKKVCDQAEIYSVDNKSNVVSFENAKLHDIDTKFQSGVSIRIIKDGKLGFAYTRNLINREELLQNALNSLKGGVSADYEFPKTLDLPKLNTYDSSIDNITSNQMVEECSRVCELLKKTNGEISSTAYSYTETIRVMNTKDTDVSNKISQFGIYGSIAYPGSASGIGRVSSAKKFEKMPNELIQETVDTFNVSSKEVTAKGGKMKVMFMPNCMYALNWRINNGTSAKSIYEKISPIADKVGEKIFSDKISIYDDPLDDKYPGARAFDDEGVATSKLHIVENGVLKNFYYDLNYAKKLNAKSTGNGYRSAQWESDRISLKPTPVLANLRYKTGNKSFKEMVKMIDRGIIIEGALGAHSGNIPNGDLSIGANPALYVENGEILGQIKDVMMAANIYELFKNVVEVSNTLYYSYSGLMPAILFDNVSVATKS